MVTAFTKQKHHSWGTLILQTIVFWSKANLIEQYLFYNWHTQEIWRIFFTAMDNYATTMEATGLGKVTVKWIYTEFGKEPTVIKG